ncbi:hypothetical protein LIER_09206 [Lithospermum erythrorhizon]|uniref:GTD-binding domain-containing protein n=1 Tax=Lithospermum erythrorhizon TaxID=34254 RepID=A0AAV3PIQ8_LITER
MADDGMGLFPKDQSEIAYLKETLHAQQNLLQKLYHELEVEREASSTAASEALSMILRLQGEKAAVKMEAEQYKRLVEEKMCYAEESLSIFEDVINQKEMEIASLDYQVQAYRYKLMSMGCTDPGIGELKFPENLLQRNEDVASPQNHGTLGRRNSAPPLNIKLLNQTKGHTERDDSTSPDMDLIRNRLEERGGKEGSGQGSDNGRTANSSMKDTNSYYEQIRSLDERIKEVSGLHLRSAASSPLPLSEMSSENSPDTSRVGSTNEIHHAKSRSSSSHGHADTPVILDVFEVPQVDPDTKPQGKTVSFAADSLPPNSIPDDALRPEIKYDSEWLKNLLASAREKNLSRPNDTSPDCNVSVLRPTARIAVSQPNSIQKIRTSEIIEVGSREEELTLLSEIKEQLNTIQSEIINLKTNHSVSKEKQLIDPHIEETLIEGLEKFYTQ